MVPIKDFYNDLVECISFFLYFYTQVLINSKEITMRCKA